MAFSHIWEIILKSNTFNFIVLAGILTAVLWKLNLPEIISKLQKNIENKVNDSTTAKTEAQKALKIAEEKMENIEQEVKSIIEETKNTAEIVSAKIIDDSKVQIKIIENNAKKVLENDFIKAEKELSDITAKTSLKLMENNIKNKLIQDKNLHQIFIDEAITELESLSI